MDYSQILIDIQLKSSIKVNSVKELKLLMDEIEILTNESIGFNTLRRLFGFLPKTKPSIKTLNTLSKFLSFSSYSAYLNDKSIYDDWYFNQQLLRIKLSNQLIDKDIRFINSGVISSKNIVPVAYLVGYFIEKKNLDLIIKLFKNLNVKRMGDSNTMKFATIVSHSFYTLKNEDAIAMINDLNTIDNFRKTVPLYYIDYSRLNSLYGKILDSILSQSNEHSDQLFVELMYSYKYFYTAKEKTEYLIKKPKEFNQFQSVLKGRYYANQILWNSKLSKNIKTSILKEIKKNNTSLFTQEIILSLIIKSHFGFLSELYDSFYEEIFEFDRWTSKTRIVISLLASALINIENKNLTMAIKNIDMIDIEKVEMGYYEFLSLFLNLIKMKISYHQKDFINNKIASENLKHLVKKTGFKRFMIESKNFTYKDH
jgi:hypothetical protein